MRIPILLCGVLVLLAQDARAGCCRIVKVDAETSTALVQVCEPDAAGACGGLLFSGTLSVGQDQAICTPSPTVLYQEWDAEASAFAAPVEALCEGGDVEI